MGLFYRVQQFFRVLSDAPDAVEREQALLILEPALAQLFRGMLPSDQAHALRVFSALQGDGIVDRDLLAAALLHDVGKSVHKPSALDRVIVILANRMFPRKVIQWGEAEPKGWRRPFTIASQHPRWGAELVAAHGASARLVELIRHHQEPAQQPASALDPLLSELRRVDGEN